MTTRKQAVPNIPTPPPCPAQKTKTVKLSTLTLNPDNPRTITDAAMARLVKSVSEFTKMLEIRPIVYDENRVILGGNMRYLALQRLGYEEVPASWVRCADNLTDDEKRRFVILDNGETFGTWDFDALANEWDDLPLADLGVDLPGSWLEDGKDDNEFLKAGESQTKNECPKCGHKW